MLDRITFTGADDSINPKLLAQLSVRYPFVEWGILVSASRYGSPRFPSHQWLMKLAYLHESYQQMNLSLHLCGQLVRDMLGTKKGLTASGIGPFGSFSRMQLNTHAVKHEVNVEDLPSLKGFEKQVIFQFDEVNEDIFNSSVIGKDWTAVLFDLSHGAGVLPESWPKPLKGVYCGYAGGLGPGNLEEQIGKIQEVAGRTKFWVDMETRVRTKDDKLFDLDLVEECLSIAEKFIPKSKTKK
jgi:hypothetical protein